MEKFRIEIRECMVKEVEVEAEDIIEAQDKVADMIYGGEIVLGLEDRTNVAEFAFPDEDW